MSPSPPTGSVVNAHLQPVAHSKATHTNQLAKISRDRMPPNFLNGLPDRRCLPCHTKGTISFKATAKLLNCLTGYFIGGRFVPLAQINRARCIYAPTALS